ncbi:MFS transporter [Paenibacillus oenotherae]|uniref:MFS transporter n=1 Tax=Paenibacillus oenotherae TaxID=1435645 RepID=A0ABS7DCT3_9BACL|nr:MFS transporter [Paenibacillus oenotherae]MBW7477312.1 MFS transporter [Paenibacillus oenotherae]
MGYTRNVWKLYVIRFFYHLIPAYVIERLFWEERGMTIQMVVYTEIIFAATVVMAEVPTGIIADKWGRKQMIVLAALLGCFEFLILVFATEFWHFALVVFLAAIGSSASSGAENALLYDSLLAEGKEKDFEKILGRMNALDIVSIIIAALCGSLLSDRFGFELNYWISLAAMIVSLGMTATLVEPGARQTNADNEMPVPMKTYITASVRFFSHNPGVSLVMLSGMVTGAAINFIDEFWQIYLNRLEIPVIYFGLFSALFFLLRLPGNVLAYKLKGRFSHRILLSAVTAVLALGFVYISAVRDYSGLAALFIICLAAGVIEPLAAGYLNHRIDSSMRATMGSFQSLGENAVLVLAGLGFGYFSSRFDVFGGFGFVAILCSAFFVYFAFASRRVVE